MTTAAAAAAAGRAAGSSGGRADKKPLAIALVGAFVAALSTSLVAVSAPVIARELHARPESVSWVLTAYLLTISCLLALAGKTADVLGRKRVYLAGFCFFVAGSGACALSSSLGVLVGARVVQGVGASMLMAVGPAIVTRSVPPKMRARGLGIQLAATYFGLTLGPGLGGLLAAKISWQVVFVVIAAVGATGGLLATIFLASDEDVRPRSLDGSGKASSPASSLDIPGAALFAFGLAALLLGFKRAQDHGWMSGATVVVLLLAVVTMVLFVRHEAKEPSPVLPLALFRRPPFAFGVLGAVVLYTVTFVLAFSLPFHLQHELHLSPSEAGAFMTAQPATMAIVAPLSGVIADRWGPRIPSTGGMLVIGVGIVSVAMTARTSGSPGVALVVSLAVVGIGSGLYVAPNSALIMGSAPRDRQATAGAMAATARNIGMTLGIAIAASLDRVVGFEKTLFAAASLACVGALLGVVRPVVEEKAQ